jgi:DNA-binding transcriptional regulator YiaG
MGDMPDQLRQMRREVRELREAVSSLQEDVSVLMEARHRKMDVPPASPDKVEKARVTKRTLKSIRDRFELMQKELAELLDVSTQTVSGWETGSSKPRKENIARIITLRNMNKGEVDEALGRQGEETEAAVPEGDDLKKFRDRLGLTQSELAELVGVSEGTVAHWETDRSRPGPQNRKELAELQSKSRAAVDELLGRPGSPDEEKAQEPEELSAAEIKEIRSELGMTQGELGDALGISAASVWNWEAGNTSPNRKNRWKLLQLSGGEMGELPGDSVRELRNELGLSQADLADEIGVSAGTISNWETGRTSPSETRLSEIRELAEGEGTPASSQ